MKCPACAHEVSDSIPACPVCGFEIGELDGPAAEAGLSPEPPAGDVHDPTSLIGRAGAARLQVRIDRFEEATGGELRVAILPRVAPLTPAQAAFWLFNRWGLGGARNRGVLILLATEERAVQCEVGYGFEAALSDSEAGKVLDFHVVPLLRQGEPTDALALAVRLVAELIEAAGEAPERTAPCSTDAPPEDPPPPPT